MQPSVGRIVHYVSFGTPGGEYTSQCRAAIVTAVHAATELHPGKTASGAHDVSETVHYAADLFVMNPTGVFLNQGCAQDEDGKHGGTWHWPERV